MSVEVQHRPEEGRFVAEVDGSTGYLTYEQGDGVIALTHTIVPVEIEGRGVASALARTAVAWVREQGAELDPQCSYVRGWLGKHPDA